MAREEVETKKPAANRHIRKRLWCAAVVLIIALVFLGLSWISGLWESQSAEERLAAIEAERAIPDDENAAVIYNHLLDDYDEGTFSDDFLAGKTDALTMGGPWFSKDHPEVAQWLEEQQGTISKLLAASKKKECRFPIITDPQEMADRLDRLRVTRRLAYLLVRAGNNDMAEGRLDAGLEKYLCLIHMGKHLRQQPVMIDYLTGVALEARGLLAVARFTVGGDPAQTHLKRIEAALPQTKDNWSEESAPILEVEKLFTRKQMRFAGWLISRWWWRITDQDPFAKAFQETRTIYLRLLTERRGSRILIALRRCKNRTGEWPESLDEIGAMLPKEILVDPSNNGSFVYKLGDDSFNLYSRGENNVDEDGNYGGGADDWPIWPQRGRKTEQKGANAK